MQPVGGLGEDQAAGAFEDLVGHLFAAAGGEAVEEDGGGPGQGEEGGVDLIGASKTALRDSTSASCPMLAQTSV